VLPALVAVGAATASAGRRLRSGLLLSLTASTGVYAEIRMLYSIAWMTGSIAMIITLQSWAASRRAAQAATLIYDDSRRRGPSLGRCRERAQTFRQRASHRP
jgi:hypothetical protein